MRAESVHTIQKLLNYFLKRKIREGPHSCTEGQEKAGQPGPGFYFH